MFYECGKIESRRVKEHAVTLGVLRAASREIIQR